MSWITTQLINCPLCGSEKVDDQAIRCDELHIVKCISCKLSFLNPRPVPADIYKLYEQNYYSDEDSQKMSYRGFEASVSNVKYYKPYSFDMLAEQVDLKDKRVLDVGCSFGKWVFWMSKAGAKVAGIDLSGQCVNWGVEKLGLDLRQCSISDLNEPDNSFDVITMIDLIEHIADIKDFMKSLVKLLKPGGVVFVQTPNFESYYKWHQEWMFLHFGMEHLLYFEAATLDKLFEMYGFLPCRDTVVVRTIPPDKQGFIRQQKNIKRRLASYLLKLPAFCGFLHRCLSNLLSRRSVYEYDSSRKSGAILIGCYRKRVAQSNF